MSNSEGNYDSTNNVLLCRACVKKLFSRVETVSFGLHLYLNIAAAGRELTPFP